MALTVTVRHHSDLELLNIIKHVLNSCSCEFKTVLKHDQFNLHTTT